MERNRTPYPPMTHPGSARALEECCLNAWPGLRYRVMDGWLLRFGDGFTRRANSVNPIAPGTDDLERKLARCEAAYAAVGQPCVFKITPLAQPPGLDEMLGRRGYAREGETSVQLLDPLRGAVPDAACTLGDPLAEVWQGAFTRMDATPLQARAPLRAILANIPVEHTAALLWEGALAVSCGRAVLEDNWVGLFDIATEPGRRRHGYARRLIGHLLHWGVNRGARRAYLQVEVANLPARALYDRLGFHEAYRYWYRSR